MSAREDGEWFCALSRRPELPIELDDCAEARNEVLVLAILDALAEAREKDPPVRGGRAALVTAAAPVTLTPICENLG